MLKTKNISFLLEYGYYRREINRINNEVKVFLGPFLYLSFIEGSYSAP
jgi:hypothetical protein